MRTKQLLAGVAIVGGVGLNFVGLVGIVVNADASPLVVAPEQDPTFTIEPAAPSISTDTGTSSSTDFGSSAPSGSIPDLSAGSPSDLAPAFEVPGAPPIDATGGASGSPGQGAPPPIAGTTSPAGPFAPNGPGGAPLGPAPGGPDGPPMDPNHACRPMWCPPPPDAPMPPAWPWNDPFWPDTSDTWEPTTVVLPSPCVSPPPPNAPPPPPLQYGGQTVSPAFDGGVQQWGFEYFGNWVPLFGAECRTPAQTGPAGPPS